jgi:hypothetical protein
VAFAAAHVEHALAGVDARQQECQARRKVVGLKPYGNCLPQTFMVVTGGHLAHILPRVYRPCLFAGLTATFGQPLTPMRVLCLI